MTIKSEPFHHPRLPDQQADIAPGSPTAVVALFNEIIRERFRPGNGLAWAWSDNPTPLEGEENEPDAPRKLIVEPGFGSANEVRNFRPAIYVDKGETVVPKEVLNNFVGQQLKTGLKGFWALARIPLQAEIVADTKQESATIADIVWFYLLAGREQIQKTFGLHEMGNPVLGRTMPADADKTQWITPVTWEVQINFRWTTKPISPLLREIVLRFQKSGETDPDAFLLSKYIR